MAAGRALLYSPGIEAELDDVKDEAKGDGGIGGGGAPGDGVDEDAEEDDDDGGGGGGGGAWYPPATWARPVAAEGGSPVVDEETDPRLSR